MVPKLPPTVAALITYLNEPLEEEHKIPISHDLLMKFVSAGDVRFMCSQADAEQLFRSSEGEESDYFSTLMKAAMMKCPPNYDSTDCGFHSFWDNNIRNILDALISRGKSIRNGRGEMSSAAKRPAFGFLMGGVCTFRGEERPYTFFGDHPKTELFSELTWTYDPAPYVLGGYYNLSDIFAHLFRFSGYYAIGAVVTLAAITHTGIKDIAKADLAFRTERIQNAVRMIKVSSLLPLLEDVIGYRDFPELEPIAQ